MKRKNLVSHHEKGKLTETTVLATANPLNLSSLVKESQLAAAQLFVRCGLESRRKKKTKQNFKHTSAEIRLHPN